MTTPVLVAVALVLGAVNAFAQSAIPAEGLAAEQAGNWAQARDIYEASLEREPHDAALWTRVADIEAHLGNLEGNVAALRHAIDEAPNDATLHQRLSQGYALLNQPLAALEAIERAVALSPSSVDFLGARATLATWLPDYGRAQDSYRRLLQLQPENHELALNLARVSAWGGRSDAAVDAYRRYLRHDPRAAAGTTALRSRPSISISSSPDQTVRSRANRQPFSPEPAGPTRRSTRSSRCCASSPTTTS